MFFKKNKNEQQYMPKDKKDEDFIKEEKVKLNEGIETQEYDQVKTFDTPKEELDELKEKEGIEINYSFNGDEVKQGLKIFQKQTIYKKNIIYTVALFLIFMLYVLNIVKGDKGGFTIFLAAMCVGLIVFIWYAPLSHIKKTAEATDENNLTFNMKIYENCVRIGEENGSFVIHYNKEITKIFETGNLFLICAGKERIFILPKRFLNSEQIVKISSLFKEKMGENFSIKE